MVWSGAEGGLGRKEEQERRETESEKSTQEGETTRSV